MSAIDTSMPHDAVSSDQISNRFWPTLLILAFGAFVIGTSEFLIMGILPDVAASIGVSVCAAGQLVVHEVEMRPIHDTSGALTHFVAVQRPG